jgi:hypothetical protein
MEHGPVVPVQGDSGVPAGGPPPPLPRSNRSRTAVLRLRRRLLTGRTRWMAAGVVLLFLGVLLLGAGLGWAGRSLVAPAAADSVDVDVIAAPTGGAETLRLPDVRGLSVALAQQALVDAGLDIAMVTLVDTPSALPTGTVVGQDPVGGTTGATAVTLTVAVSGSVPDLVGTDASTAIQTLTGLGVNAKAAEVYDPAATVGTVLALDPPPGAVLPRDLTVTVAGPAGSLFLTDMAARSSCGTGSANANGATYAHSLLCSAGTSARTTEYLLDRVTTQLIGTLGVLDTSDLEYAGRVTIRGDGVELYSSEVRFGTEVAFTVATAGVLQLQIEYVRLGADAGSVDGQLVLGDARVVGSPRDVEALADR